MIRSMLPSDWNDVAFIYTQALVQGNATFQTTCPTHPEWDAAHLPECRLVCEEAGRVVGWAALSPTSSRPAYRGVVEVSVYVFDAFQSKGVGTALLLQLCRDSERAGFWCLYSAIFSSNAPSLALHRRCGFREIGYRERIARDRFGHWQNTTLMERRAADATDSL